MFQGQSEGNTRRKITTIERVFFFVCDYKLLSNKSVNPNLLKIYRYGVNTTKTVTNVFQKQQKYTMFYTMKKKVGIEMRPCQEDGIVFILVLRNTPHMLLLCEELNHNTR